jgi:hypothetical protein
MIYTVRRIAKCQMEFVRFDGQTRAMCKFRGSFLVACTEYLYSEVGVLVLDWSISMSIAMSRNWNFVKVVN